MSVYYIANYPVSDELFHHGILGMRWGIRRYQNEDGTLTEAGKKHYARVEQRSAEIQEKNKRQIERGKTLLDKNRTKIGGIGRGIGRQIGIGAIAKIGTVALGALMLSQMSNMKITDLDSNSNTVKLLNAEGLISQFGIPAAALGFTVANISRSYRDVRDISKAEGAGYKKKKDRLPNE